MSQRVDLAQMGDSLGWMLNITTRQVEFGQQTLVDGVSVATVVTAEFRDDELTRATVDPSNGPTYLIRTVGQLTRVLSHQADVDLDSCPECGHPVTSHGGWGGPGCSLTDNGAAQRAHARRKAS